MKKPIFIFLLLVVISFSSVVLWRIQSLRLIQASASAESSQKISPANANPVEIVNQAQRLADQGNFEEAIGLINQIKPINDDEAKILAEVRQRWQAELAGNQGESQLVSAMAQYNNGHVEAAINTAEKIADTSPAKQEYARKFRRLWFKNATLLELAKKFHEEGRCTTALLTISQIRDRSLLESKQVKMLKAAIDQMQASGRTQETL